MTSDAVCPHCAAEAVERWGTYRLRMAMIVTGNMVVEAAQLDGETINLDDLYCAACEEELDYQAVIEATRRSQTSEDQASA